MPYEPNRLFTSRIITNLDNEIRNATDNTRRNIAFAKKAFALARFSLISEAKTIIQQLRKINSAYEPRLSAWIMFAEGVIEHSHTLNLPKAKDRVLRGHLVAQAANDPGLAATAAAWLAYFSFVEGKYQESGAYLAKAFAWSIKEDWEARSRASMVIGQGYYFSGEPETAKIWFQRARNAAVDSGDIAMQSTILFNASAYHVAQLTLEDCIGPVRSEELHFALMSFNSASNLNTALGIMNQPSMVAMQRAELLTVAKRWDEAIALFDSQMEQCANEGQSMWVPKFHAQRAWCKANLSDHDGARWDLHIASARAAEISDPDDRAVLHLRLASVAQLLDERELADQHKFEGQKFFAIHRQHQQVVKAILNEVVATLAK